jgi:hypothetical protein
MNTCICCNAQNKAEALKLAGPKVKVTIFYTENIGMGLARIQGSFCVGGSGAVLLPLEVPCTKSTSRERKTFLDYTGGGEERKGNWPGRDGIIM